MKQAILTQPGHIEIRDVPAPQAGPGEVLLRIRRIGVCGSDVHVWHGKHPYTSYPVVQGHEFVGTVEAVGEGVSGVTLGAKATALPQEVCGQCAPCRRGDWHVCEKLKVRGFQAPGCAQEWFVVPAERLVVLPESMTLDQGAMVEPVAVAVHAVARGPSPAGLGAVVLGAGPIGNLVAQVAMAEGAQVLITDTSETRLEVARQCGLTRTHNPQSGSLADAARAAFGPAGFSVVYDCAGVESAIGEAVETMAKGSTAVVVAVYADRPRLDLGLVQDRELTLTGTLMYQKGDYERGIELLAGAQVDLEPLMGEHFRLEDYEAAYERIDRAGAEVMKLFIDL